MLKVSGGRCYSLSYFHLSPLFLKRSGKQKCIKKLTGIMNNKRMKFIFFILISFILLKPVVFAQGTQTDSLFQSDSLAVNIEKPVKAAPLNAEKLAWEMMQPPGYKKQEKTPEMKSYEEILMRMKSGTAELSLILREFELTSFEKQNKKK